MAENADALTLGNVEAEPVKYVLPNSKDFTSPLTRYVCHYISPKLFCYRCLKLGVYDAAGSAKSRCRRFRQRHTQRRRGALRRLKSRRTSHVQPFRRRPRLCRSLQNVKSREAILAVMIYDVVIHHRRYLLRRIRDTSCVVLLDWPSSDSSTTLPPFAYAPARRIIA